MHFTQAENQTAGSGVSSLPLCWVVGYLCRLAVLWEGMHFAPLHVVVMMAVVLVCSVQKKSRENTELLSETGACTVQFRVVGMFYLAVCIDLFFFPLIFYVYVPLIHFARLVVTRENVVTSQNGF